MKKYIYILCLFILGLLMVPKLVLAQENLPREGVYYFLTYPNGEETVTGNYEEAENPEEKLIYSGVTNTNGEIVVEGLGTEGTLRIVQKVPNGYTTEEMETTLDLSEETRKVEFVDSKGTNPKTSQSLIFIGVLALVLVGSIVVVKSGAKKQLVFLLPAILIGTFAIKVFAMEENLVITVKDKAGNKLNGVVVEIYAKPKVTPAPAVKFSANGGTFFDGTTEMILKLPSATCTADDFWDSLTAERHNYLINNIYDAYRAGYKLIDYEDKETLTNGTVINVIWEEDSTFEYVTIHGNGGVYNFYGKELNTVTIGKDYFSSFENKFVNGKQFRIGYDSAASCSHYTENGILTVREEDLGDLPDDVYVCWRTKPDGIYVNGLLFLGNDQSCYSQSNFSRYTDAFSLSNGNSHIYFGNTNSSNLVIIYKADTMLFLTMYNGFSSSDEINDIQVIKNGQTIVSLAANELELQDNDHYTITNEEKLNTLTNYFAGLYTNSCLIGS